MARTGKESPYDQLPKRCEPECDPTHFSKHGTVTKGGKEYDFGFCTMCSAKLERPKTTETPRLKLDEFGRMIEQ